MKSASSHPLPKNRLLGKSARSVSDRNFHCAAKGGTQKGIGHFFRHFWSPFGDDFVTFFDIFGHLFAYPLLPPPFCGRVKFCHGRPPGGMFVALRLRFSSGLEGPARSS